MRPRPWTLLLAVVALALEAAGLLVAAVVSTADTVSGQSYHQSSGIALSILAYLAAIVAGLVGRGVFRVSQWSRTPALYIQLFVGTTGVYLLQDHHLDWGLPALLVAIVGFLGVCLPASWRILSRPGLEEREELAAQAAAEAEPEPEPVPPARPAPRKKASARRR
jgi:peptidoglycan/LPS O-acetylase OafA/YrhL